MLDTVVNLIQRYILTHASPVNVVRMLLFSVHIIFFPQLCFLLHFQRDLGNVNVQMFHFVISFIFKNLCTMFYINDLSLQVLGKKSELIHSCAILYRCTLLLRSSPASAVPDKQEEGARLYSLQQQQKKNHKKKSETVSFPQASLIRQEQGWMLFVL